VGVGVFQSVLFSLVNKGVGISATGCGAWGLGVVLSMIDGGRSVRVWLRTVDGKERVGCGFFLWERNIYTCGMWFGKLQTEIGWPKKFNMLNT